jgi:LEA14-like dessication related protein
MNPVVRTLKQVKVKDGEWTKKVQTNHISYTNYILKSTQYYELIRKITQHLQNTHDSKIRLIIKKKK